MLTLFLLACPSPVDPIPDGSVAAIVDATRGEHFFDMPFPTDAQLDPLGFPRLDGFPSAPNALFDGVLQGWVDRLTRTAQGWGNNTASYFRFEGPLDLPPVFTTEGLPTDEVLLVALDGSELLPLEGRFVADPKGDPFWGENTLAVAPALGHPPRSGSTYAAVVMTSAGARAPAGYALPDGVTEALAAAGVSGEPAVATVFTPQDATGQLRTLIADLDARLEARPLGWGTVAWREVTQLSYYQGETPSGQPATVSEVTYADGSTRLAYQSAEEPDAYTQSVDFLEGPMVVYEAELPVLNYQGLADRPYMRAGIGHLLDVDTYTGWIDFSDGELVSEPEEEFMRVVVAIPRGDDGQPITDARPIIYDHGTGGMAYHALQRRNRFDRSDLLNQAMADRRYAIIGRDASLYGTRYPLIDEGHGSSLGFYNIVNLPAFRDNQRQTALDGHALLRYLEQQINDDLPAGGLDMNKVRRIGHSLGSVTTNLGLAANPDAHHAALLSGTGGVFALYALETGFLGTYITDETLDGIFPILGVDEPPEVYTVNSILGAALGLPEAAWDDIDRLHPVMTVFQWTMDPSDPMAIARDETVDTLVYVGRGDYQVPNRTSDALAEAQPQSTLVYCEPTSDYDPHQCLWRETEGLAAFESWLDAP